MHHHHGNHCSKTMLAFGVPTCMNSIDPGCNAEPFPWHAHAGSPSVLLVVMPWRPEWHIANTCVGGSNCILKKKQLLWRCDVHFAKLYGAN